MARRRGRDLEVLVHAIESSLADDEYTSVESPGWLIDKSTSERREFDVLITRKEPHRTTVVGIECKDWKRPLDSPVVEQFKKKCEECGVHRGVIVSSIGFGRSARRKAERLEVDCLTLKQATGQDWRTVDEIVAAYRNLVHMEAFITPEADCQGPVTLWARDDEGAELDLSHDGHQWMAKHFNDLVNSGELDDVHMPGSTKYRVSVHVLHIDNLFLKCADGTKTGLKALDLRFEFEQHRSAREPDLYSYGVPDSNQFIKVSAAKLDFSDLNKELAVTVVERPDGVVTITHNELEQGAESNIRVRPSSRQPTKCTP